MTTRVLLVLVAGSDPSVTDLARRELRRHGMHVTTATTGEYALRSAQQQRPDLVIIAMQLPDMSGTEVLRRLRASGPLPAILLTEGRSTATSTAPRNAGTLTLPFTPDQLASAVSEALGQPAAGTAPILAGDIEVDLAQRLVRRAGRALALTRTEWALLAFLAGHAGRTLAAEDILSSVWGPEYRDDLQFLRVWISRLRAKLGGDALTIATVRGVGYVFQPGPDAPLPPRRPKAARI
jgi:DNA-binding response OmpR family regulator